MLVSGDVFDRPMPPVDALALGLGGLPPLAERRARGRGGRQPRLARAVRRARPARRRTRAAGSTSSGRCAAPTRAGSSARTSLGVPAVVAAFPFLREGRVVDFMRDTGEWYGAYADRVAAITAVFNARSSTPRAATSSRSSSRTSWSAALHVGRFGERELHVGEAYAATSQAIPPGPQYVAHRAHPRAAGRARRPGPRPVRGVALALDFGEAGETKRVVVVEAEPGRLGDGRVGPARERPSARARGGDLGRARRSRGRARGRVPRPHRAASAGRTPTSAAGPPRRSPTWSTSGSGGRRRRPGGPRRRRSAPDR